jgi:hypothetical protein
MGQLLSAIDEGTHQVGTAETWNESRYVDIWDRTSRIGGWLRLGNRPNQGYAEMSVCLYLPDGRVAFMFARPEIDANGQAAGGNRGRCSILSSAPGSPIAK